MTKSKSRSEDERRGSETPDRVSKVHGGQVVEAIAPEELESFNDAGCKHPKLVPDPSETDFQAFICANPDCNEVFLYDKAS